MYLRSKVSLEGESAVTRKKDDSPVPAGETKHSKIPIVWLVPLVAALTAAWLIYNRVQNVGPTVTVVFSEGQGLEAGQTAVRYRGVKVGDVRAVSLTEDGQGVEARIVLDKSAKNAAQQGTLYWVVRPEVSAGGLHGLETLVSGTYIQVQPGTGKESAKFTGLEHPPMIPSTKGGLEITLTASELGSLSAGSPVYFRGMEVGSVEFYSLSEDSTQVKVRIRIENRFAPLVTQDSKFWNAGGLNVSLKLFGINVSAESIKSLLTGGVAFANPPSPGPPAKDGSVFPLYSKPDDKWLKWVAPLPVWEPSTNTEAGR